MRIYIPRSYIKCCLRQNNSCPLENSDTAAPKEMEKVKTMKHVFLILAAGKSSRFGGYPKAFCKIGNTCVAQRTVDFGAPYFDETYLVLNEEIFPQYQNVVTGCKTLAIRTGQGDSHSFLRAARLVKQNSGADRITLCWGDTFYLNDGMFKRAARMELDETCVGVSLASLDSEPYAWYETDGDKIRASRFMARDGAIKEGIHDQSVFVFHLNAICSQLEVYMKTLGILDEEDYGGKKTLKEMKLLDAFAYFYNNDLLPMKYELVTPGQSFSFNTEEELKIVRKNADSSKHGN